MTLQPPLRNETAGKFSEAAVRSVVTQPPSMSIIDFYQEDFPSECKHMILG